MFLFEWPENFLIFLDNLCIYHVCFDLISFLVIIFTWWYCNSGNSTAIKEGQLIDSQSETVSEKNVAENLNAKEIFKENDVSNWYDDTIISNVKFLRQKALVKELKSKLTQDELEEERKTEKMQLEKIFQLLQEQEDKFHMSSMEQLEDQLHMYVN